MKVEIKNDDGRSDPLITIDQSEIEARGTHGAQVAQIDVTREDGSIQRYWVTMKQHSSNNRIFCEIVVNDLKAKQSRKKSIFGHWFQRHASSVAIQQCAPAKD
jgi:hypothetical protein